MFRVQDDGSRPYQGSALGRGWGNSPLFVLILV